MSTLSSTVKPLSDNNGNINDVTNEIITLSENSSDDEIVDSVNIDQSIHQNTCVASGKAGKSCTKCSCNLYNFQFNIFDLCSLEHILKEEDKFYCNICNESFRYKIGLTAHLYEAHNVDATHSNENELKLETKRKKVNQTEDSDIKTKKKRKIHLKNDDQKADSDTVKATKEKVDLENKVTEDKRNENNQAANGISKNESIFITKRFFFKGAADKGSPYKCKKCSAVFKIEETHAHAIACSKLLVLKCEFCSAICITERNFRRHMYKKHNMASVNICKQCTHTFKDPDSLRSHAQNCKGNISKV